MQNKFGAVKKIVDGIKFDSTTESQFYEYLKELGLKLFEDFEMQVEYELIKRFKFNEKSIRPTKYYSDFTLTDGTVIDVKGHIITPVFKLKNKLMKLVYNKEILTVVKAPKYYTKATNSKWVLMENLTKIRSCKNNKGDFNKIVFKRTLKEYLVDRSK